MPMSNYPQGFNHGLNVRGLPVLNAYGGNVFWVDSEFGSDNSFQGTFARPFATIDYAIGRCTASNGDIIMVKPGHAETITTSITMDVAGVSVVGLGVGQNRPAITTAATTAAFNVTAANTAIMNLRFPGLTSGTQAGTRKITVSGAQCVIRDNEFVCDASDDNAVYVDVSGDYAEIVNNVFRVSANGPDTAILLEGADGGDTLTNVKIADNFFDGGSATNSWDEGVIYSSGVHTNCLVEGNNFLFMSGGVGGVEFVAAATGLLRDNFFGGGTLGQMLDPGSCYCTGNWEADAIDEKAREFPTSGAS